MKKRGGTKSDKTDDELVNTIFSWSLEDVMNKHLFRDKVNIIPDKFFDLKGYLESFRNPLLEEIRAEMSSTLEALPSYSSTVRIQSLVPKAKNRLLYRITISTHRRAHSPCRGDIIVLSEKMPNRPSDLTGNSDSYCLAHVCSVSKDKKNFVIKASKKIDADANPYTFALSLLAFIPYSRIWWCLDYETAVERDPALVKVAACYPYT